MATARDLNAILLEMVERNPDCDVDELAVHCPQATWNQVFLTLDNLSRSGKVSLRQQGSGRYKVELAPQRQARSRVLSQNHA